VLPLSRCSVVLLRLLTRLWRDCWQASHDVVGAGGDVPSRDGESAARSASSAVRCRVK
jgi:hypothetical protein